MVKSINIYFIISILAIIILILLSVFYGINRPYIFDDSVFMLFADDLSQGLNPYYYYDNKPPLFHLFIAGYLKIFGHNPISGRILSIGIMVLIASLSVLLFKHQTSLTEKLYIWSFSYLILLFFEASLLYTEILLTVFGFVFYYLLSRNFIDYKSSIWVGIITGILIFSKPVALIFSAAFCLVIVCEYLNNKFKRTLYYLSVISFNLLTILITFSLAILVLKYFGIADIIIERSFLGLFDFEKRGSTVEYLFLLFRTAWVIVPVILLFIYFLLSKKSYLEDKLLLFSFFIVFFHLILILKRPYAHYFLSSFPAIIYIIIFSFIKLRNNIEASKLKATFIALGFIFLISSSVCIYLKRFSINNILYGNRVSESKLIADELGKYIENEDDKLLIINGGINQFNSTASYYYSGLRPSSPLLFYSDVPKAKRDLYLEIMIESIGNDHTKLVLFQENVDYDKTHYPIDQEMNDKISLLLNNNYEKIKIEELNNLIIWVKNPRVANMPKIFRGPYKNQ